jgi:hypothetical protein
MRVFVFAFVWLVGLGVCRADETAAVTGLVTDPVGKSVPGVKIAIVNLATNIEQTTATNDQGIYRVVALEPGIYRITLLKDGFKSIVKSGIELHVQDVASINFELQVGSVSETVTVSAGAPLINTTDASVSTVIDRQFVENIPLNGRSLQSLITLTPGVLVVPGTAGAQGEFSVNGQRTESNYFTVDGVSANTGASVTFNATANAGISGSVAGETALGTTQSLLSLDALQEFRATTSTYSAEYGRTPGGQFSFVSRSGTNAWHGTGFDYFRNEALDANNWFSDAAGIPKTPERQNDFGGTLGGPIWIPGLYNGRDRTFFFFSYEGLRLQLPAGVRVNSYPDAFLRQNAAPAMRPLLNAFPVPNGPEVLDATGHPTGLALFTAAFSNPSDIDSISIRVDHQLTKSTKIFGRYSGTTSASGSRGGNLAILDKQAGNIKTLTVGATTLFSARVVNDLRFNYTRNDSSDVFPLDNFGGAQPFTLDQVPGFSGGHAQGGQFGFFLVFNGGGGIDIGQFEQPQQHWNVTDAFSLLLGDHSLKFGIDYRRLSTYLYVNNLSEFSVFRSESQVLSGIPGQTFVGAFSAAAPDPIYSNFSAYAQDEWRASPRLSLTFGLRWDVNPPPGNGAGNPPYTLNQIPDLSTAHIAPAGTPLWHTDYLGFAPRLGAAYVLRRSAGYETVIRGGFGIFYDMGNTVGTGGFLGVGFSTGARYSNVPFPLLPAQLVLPPASIAPPYNQTIYAFDPNLKLPYTKEWNVSLEQAIGSAQALKVAYVGSAGRRLLFFDTLFPTNAPNFSSGNGVQITTGRSSSDYDALQVQFQKRLSHGLQALASYTWSHSIDDTSTNFFSNQLVRGSSDFDIRHNFQMALTYDIPGSYKNRLMSGVLRHWGVDLRISARSGLPVDIIGNQIVLPNGQQVSPRPDLVPGVPIYLYGPQYPGGKSLNFNAFVAAPNGTQGDLPRNFARGFAASQVDLALRRTFPIGERLRLQFRAEAFNIFNHPNFSGNNQSGLDNFLPDGPYDPVTHRGFGGASTTLNNTLGGLNTLYQIGGPRSLQLALKLVF